MADREDLTERARFAASVPARHEPFPLKGCGALDWGMQNRLARIFQSHDPAAMIRAVSAVVHSSLKPQAAHDQFLRPPAGGT